jgi:hypothetical protein
MPFLLPILNEHFVFNISVCIIKSIKKAMAKIYHNFLVKAPVNKVFDSITKLEGLRNGGQPTVPAIRKKEESFVLASVKTCSIK